MNRNRLIAVLSAVFVGGLLAVAIPVAPAAAALPAPIILNNGAQNGANAQWMETQAQPDDGGTSVKQFWFTFLVQHAVGRTINQVFIQGPGVNGNVGVTGQTYVASAGGIETSRVTASIGLTKPGGFSCPFIGSATRSVDATVTMRVIDSTGENSGNVSSTVKFVEDSNCNLRQDFPRMTGISQNTTEINPTQTITYTFSCDDVDADLLSSDDDCDRANIRWRRLNDGDVSSNTLKTGINDNTNTTHVMSFPSRGIYVVEAQLGNEDGNFPNLGGNSGGWWRLGNAVVNDAASTLSGSLAFSGAQTSSPPSVNPGTAVTATATVDDSAGSIQVIEWDADGNNAYERREYTVPVNSSGNIVHSDVTLAERQQSVNTSTAGLKTVNSRITDNGAIDAADSIRRQQILTGQLRVNAIPTASNVSDSTNEDTPKTITLVGNDSDNQPAPLTYSIVSGPPVSAGSLGTVSGNQVTFTPASNFNGSTSFTYRVSDGPGDDGDAFANSTTATVNITVNAVNDPPTVDPKSATTDEDTNVNIQATGSDVEGPLTWAVDSQPANGTASCHPTTGLCTYDPADNFFGNDSFVVRGTDNGTPGLSATATFSVTVDPVNDAPVANDQSVTVPEDAVNFPIIVTATDVDNVTLTFAAPIDDVDHGTLNCLGNACTYSPALNYNGPDSFTFEVSDGSLTDIGTVTIDVSAVNDAPVATDVPDAETDEDVTLPLTLGGTDVDAGDTVAVDSVTDPPNGTTNQTGPNAVDYLGDLNFNGIDSFDFTVTDNNGGFDTGTVVVTVHPVNDAPVVNDQSFTTTEDTPALLSIVASDVDGDALSWSIVTPPTNGQVFGSGPDVGYAPNTNFHGTDTFTVQVSDGELTDTAVITVTVDPVNDQPVAAASTISVDEDSSVGFTLGVSDVDGDILTVTAPVAGPFNGSAVCSGTACTYSPNSNFNGADVFTFTVDDGNGGTDTASVTITVDPVNDQPVANGASVTTDEDTPVAISLSASDIDGDLLTYSPAAPTSGTLQGIAPSVVYTPGVNFNGSDGFLFTASDGNGGTDVASVAITVNPVNDAPIATGGSTVTDEDVSVGFQLGASDVEGDSLTFSVTTPPSDGTVACDAAGACTYDPPADFTGEANVYYDVSDGFAIGSGVFIVVVAPLNDPPVADDSSLATPEDTALSITLAATDIDGDALTYSVTAPPAHGTLECSADSTSCVFTPAPNYNGPDSLQWSVSDGNSADTATVTIAVDAVNDAPQALDTSATVIEEGTIMVPLIASDAEGDAITFTIVSGPSNGSISVSGSSATYTPAVDFNGIDTFVYRATDPSGASTQADGTVVVEGAPLIATKIFADPVVLYIRTNGVGVLNVKATLKAGPNPLPGRTLNFFVKQTPLCSGVTDAKGVASCQGLTTQLTAVLNLGYRVVFNGDADYAPIQGVAAIIGIQDLRI